MRRLKKYLVNRFNIDAQQLEQVISLCDQVIGSGQYNLHTDFANNFLAQTENGFAWQALPWERRFEFAINEADLP